jgi:NO-binding membrane sensor protein with MHYT domain/two-component sensor histidine kinase
MTGTYDLWLVLLSFIVAVNASFVALELATRVVASRGRRSEWAWLAGGAAAMGTGIWSTHFIGMLAFRLPAPTSYDTAITLLSLAIGVLSSGIALFVASRSTLTVARLCAAGALIGTGIAAMHYVGMAAMRMQPPIRYAPGLVVLSILIAVTASVVTVWTTFRLRLETIVTAFGKKAGSALMMGAGISGMHYTGMAAAKFAAGSVCTAPPWHLGTASIGGALGAFALVFLVLALLVCSCQVYRTSVLDAKVAQGSGMLEQASSELRRLMRRLADLQEEERRRLAAELHDIVGQSLSALMLEISMIRDQLEPAASVALAARLASAAALARQSIEAVRGVMAELRPPGIDEVGLPAALQWNVDRFKLRTGIAVTLTVDPSLPRPSSAVEEALLRVAAEALNNAAKYSQARSVQIRLEERDEAIAFEVADDGCGFDPALQAPRNHNRGWGLKIMYERALAVGAQLRVVSAPGAGTRVRFLISKRGWR